MSIASELQNYADGLDDSYDAIDDMGGIIPAHKNMDNLDQAIRTIPQNTGTTYTAGAGIDITSDVISVDDSGLKNPTVTGAYCYYRKSGRFVWVSGNSSGFALTAGDYTTIFTLPLDYRPPIDIYCPLGLSPATKVGVLRIKTTGEVQGWADSNTTYWNFNTAFVVD